MKHVEDDEDAFDERGILRDGKTFRLPMRMADSLQRQVRDFAAQQLRDARPPLHRAGFVYRDAAARQIVQDAYRDYDLRQGEAYKTPSVKAAPDATDSRRAAAEDRTHDCYSEYDARVASAWRGGGAS